MKIGIVTQPLSRNYGGILQNYALQQTLIKLGHTPYTFDIGKYTWNEWVISTLKNIVKMIIGRSYNFIDTPSDKYKKEQILRTFVEQHINLISPRSKRPIEKKIKEYKLESIIVGSDQVWRPLYNPYIEDMYLGFVNNQNVKKIAYAASFGIDEWEYTEEQTLICQSLVKKFKALSVREVSGINLCKMHLNVEAIQLVDPTILLSVEDYKKLVSHIQKPKYKFLFAYILDQTSVKVEYIKKIAHCLGLKYIIKGSDEKLLASDSVENWIANFRDAEYVITDSFHGSVFSIIFNKSFIALGNNTRGMSRFNSLFTMFGLETRLLNSEEYSKVPDENINWTEINSKIKLYRKKSLEFLTKNL